MNNKYSSTDEITALLGLYQAERADTASIFTNALAILGFAVAYVAAVLAFVNSASTLHGVLLAFTPTPACGLVAYHQVMVGMNGARAASAQRLENKINAILNDNKLVVQAGHAQGFIQPKQAVGELKFGIIIGEKFLDPGQASRARALGSGATYITLVLATVGFSWFMLALAARHNAGVPALVCGSLFAAIGIGGAAWNLVLNGRRPEVRILGRK